MRIFIDLDGVLADFFGGVRRTFPDCPAEADWPRGEYSMPKVLGVSNNEFWGRIDAEGSAWWAGLEPYPWATDLVARASALGEIIIATSPSLNGACHQGKLEWLYEHFGSGFRAYAMIACGKDILARPDALLIDDLDRTVEGFAAAGGNAILFPRVWNGMHERASDPMAYVEECLIAARKVDPRERLKAIEGQDDA